jgi:hypothetical protein
MRGLPAIGLGAFGLLLLARPCAADVISPVEQECRNRAAGAACTVGDRTGTCVESTCSRLDYSGGVPPRSVSAPCRVCDVSKATPGKVTPVDATPGKAAPGTSGAALAIGAGALALVGGVLFARRWHGRDHGPSAPGHS